MFRKSNLSKNEIEGLKWLKETKGKISVVQADKGGAIIIADPNLLRKKVLEKLENEQLYTKLQRAGAVLPQGCMSCSPGPRA